MLLPPGHTSAFSLPDMEASGLQQLLPGVLLKVQRAAAPGAPGRSRWQSSSASSSMAVTNPVVHAGVFLEVLDLFQTSLAWRCPRC